MNAGSQERGAQIQEQTEEKCFGNYNAIISSRGSATAVWELLVSGAGWLRGLARSFPDAWIWRSRAELGQDTVRIFHLPAERSYPTGSFLVCAEEWLTRASRKLIKFQRETFWKMIRCHSWFLIRAFQVKITLLFPIAVSFLAVCYPSGKMFTIQKYWTKLHPRMSQTTRVNTVTKRNLSWHDKNTSKYTNLSRLHGLQPSVLNNLPQTHGVHHNCVVL